MSKRRMVGWQPLAVENTDAPAAPADAPAEPQPVTEHAAPAPQPTPVQEPVAAEPVVAANGRSAPAADGPIQDPNVARRRMAGWEPLAVANSAAPTATAAPAAPAQPAETGQSAEASASAEPATAEPVGQPAQPTGPIQDPDVPRRRMAGWQPLTVAHDAPTAAPAATPAAAATSEVSSPAAPTTPAAEAASAAAPAEPQQAAVPAPVTEDLPRRRMDGWEPLKVGHPATAAPAVEPEATPAAEPTAAPVAEQAPAAPRRRMGAPASQSDAPAGQPKRMGAPASAPAESTKPDVVTPTPAKPAASQPAATKAPDKAKKELSKPAKVVLTLLGVAVVAAGLVLLAQWIRSLDPVAEFIATYDGTPTHPDGVEPGIPAWVGWQHFFNFFIMVMVIRSGLLIRNQERPEAYWTPNDGGFFSPNKKNTPQKVSIQQWIHQSFNVLWVVNGLIFYIMVFATGHWMRIVPTNWDIFPNMLSAGIQYLSLDWPPENSWVYYNALQIMTYFITVFVAAPIAILTGLRLSTWWPQNAAINKAFPLPVARTTHFVTMVYFILFIIVHLFLVFTTGVLTNLNVMFTARDAHDWWGIGVFAVSVAVTVGVAWLIKPIFISPIAEKTGTVSTR